MSRHKKDRLKEETKEKRRRPTKRFFMINNEETYKGINKQNKKGTRCSRKFKTKNLKLSSLR